MENQSFQLQNPLANFSLFPSTFSVQSFKPSHDLDAIHNNLKSMELRSPAKFVELAKSILEENMGFNTERSTQDDVGNDVVFTAEEGEELPRKRRPGLGLNRARPRFSLKESKKPSVEDLLPSLDMKNLKDPEEFFVAHERWENAKKEIQKQLRIEPTELNQNSTKPRERRPGLGLNQRQVRYKHRSTETLIYNDDVLSSQETLGSDSLDPVGDTTDKGKASLASLDEEVTGSSAVEENKIDDILHGLLTCDSEELEGVGAMNLLQERLQIKPIVVEKLSIPDFPDIQPTDLKSLRGNLSKPRKALSNVDNLLKGMNIKTPIRRNVGCAQKQLGSPTPPRSPFASFSTLQKHISRSKSSVDPFSAHEIDRVSTRKSPTHNINQEVNIVGSSKPSVELSAPIIEDVTTVGEINEIRNTSEKSKEDNSRKSSDKVNAPSIEDRVAVSEKSSVEDPARNSTSTPQKAIVDNSRESGFDANVDSNEPPVDMDVDIVGSGCGDDTDVDIEVSDMGDDTVGRQNVEPNVPYQFVDKMLEENLQEITTSIPTDDANFNMVIPQVDQSNPVGYEANSLDKKSTRSDDGPEQGLQENTVVSVKPVNGKTRVKSCAQKESRGTRLQKRKSLADAGTSWKTGVRRSTRFRTRPLEYWKGERMVYGRVHESLATVIGVKCMSPGSNGKPTMKVKSFVSDKYKELFEITSLH